MVLSEYNNILFVVNMEIKFTKYTNSNQQSSTEFKIIIKMKFNVYIFWFLEKYIYVKHIKEET